MFERLAKLIDHPNADRVQHFRDGTDFACVTSSRLLVCVLAGASLFDGDAASLWQQSEASNTALLASLKEDRNSAELHSLTCADAEKGRMSWPVPAEDVSLTKVSLSFCFGARFSAHACPLTGALGSSLCG